MRLPSNLVLLAAAGLMLAAPASAQPPAAPAPAAAPPAAKPMDAAERKAVIENLAKDLEDDFVFPDIADRYAAMLRANLKAGAYDQLTDPKAFGEKVTADLQAVASDGHLKLAPMDVWNASPARAAVDHAPQARLGLEETRMIGKVAYLRFSLFPGDTETARRARQFLLDHATAQAVIIDSRPNHGGGLDEMNAILPLLYAQPVTLVRMDTRASAAEHAPFMASLVRQPSPPAFVRNDHRIVPDAKEKRLQSVPVYYLTSAKTASAAEHLALAFRHTHRAIQVGETTRGAGHYGGLDPIGDRFGAFIPIGRTYDPDTNWDWEGKGVAPDVAVPADQALDEALKRLKAKGVDVGS